ncbi:MAG: imidazoleglycerol-phosphate dehydratase [Nioella sp.]|nr:imidazoleglycerol-phosphate dehydratase [Nioella sp.]
MKKALLGAALLIGLAGMAAADPLEGTWRTAPDDNGNTGLVVVAPCGAQLCGTLTTAYDSSGNEMQSPNVGRQIISETEPQGGGEYRGRVYSPDRDRTYNSRLQLNGDTLSVSGCVLGICRDGGTWTRQ